MIVDKVDRPLVIDLTGPQGNAFYLLGFASKNARKFNIDGQAIVEEMKSGNYEHLVAIFDKYFGEYVILER
jgi:hypothetical protein